MKKIDPSTIKVGNRLREDFGDIAEIAGSIQKYGMLHAIVIDDDRNLVAGHRRLMACQALGKKRVEVVFYGELDEKQRREIELEENIRRKDLTPQERSKKTKELLDIAEEIHRGEQLGGNRPVGHNPKGGRREAARRIGIARGTARDADAHVAAMKKYPFLDSPVWGQQASISMAKLLDEIGKRDSEYLLRFVMNGNGGAPEQMRNYFETWKAASPKVKSRIKKCLSGHPERSDRTVSLMAGAAPTCDEVLLWTRKTVRDLKQIVESREAGDGLLPALNDHLKSLQKLYREAKKHNDESIERLREEIAL